MKKIYLVFVDTKDGKYYAHSETFRVGDVLETDRYPLTKVIHICETATEASYLAVQMNEDYKDNNTYMY